MPAATMTGMKQTLSYFVVFALCLLAYIYSERIAKAFARFYAQYPLARLLPGSRHQARGIYIRLGAVVIAAVVTAIAILQLMGA